MASVSMLEDLFRYNRWATDRIFAMCGGLTDTQLDEPREMGFGSLRNTLFHILAAEEIWLERWESKPWRQFETDSGGQPLAEIARRLHRADEARGALLARESQDGWKRIVVYKNAKGEEFQNRLSDLAQHVANHGVHHRAQALNFLKQFGVTAPGGLDYLFFRLAKPSLRQTPESAAALRDFGLEIATGESPAVTWSGELARKYFAYGDWANDRLLALAERLDDAALERDWGMGLGTIRKTALHIHDAERWWLNNWTIGTTMYERSPTSTTIGALRELWTRLRPSRNDFLKSLDANSSQRVVTVKFGGPPLDIPVVESTLQLGGHGTHHRAQLLNMLRRSGIAVPALDLVVWLRETA